MLSGLGVPDMRGTNGQPTVYTTRTGRTGKQFAVKVTRLSTDTIAGAADTVVEGPRNLLFPPPPDPSGRCRSSPATWCRPVGPTT